MKVRISDIILGSIGAIVLIGYISWTVYSFAKIQESQIKLEERR